MCTVLIIEEDAPTVRLLAWALRETDGYEVLSADGLANAASAVAATPDYILVNTHMRLPDKREYIASLRYLVPDVSVIDLRSSGEDDGDSGADAYISPPYLDSLVATLHRLATTKEGLSS